MIVKTSAPINHEIFLILAAPRRDVFVVISDPVDHGLIGHHDPGNNPRDHNNSIANSAPNTADGTKIFVKFNVRSHILFDRGNLLS